MENKALWDSVKVTDPAVVKAITGKSYQGSSPKPYWLIERATEVFGPVGIGWGVDVVSERFERMSDTDVLHVAVVSVWYMHNGERSHSFEQMGGTKACYMAGSGKLMVDEDAGKKSVTDGMVKCLSMIGFAGDIFSGQWNDSKYVDWAAEQYNKPAPRTAEQEEQRGAWLEDQFVAIDAAKTVGDLKRIIDAALAITAKENDDDAARQILAARDAKAAKAKRNREAITA